MYAGPVGLLDPSALVCNLDIISIMYSYYMYPRGLAGKNTRLCTYFLCRYCCTLQPRFSRHSRRSSSYTVYLCCCVLCCIFEKGPTPRLVFLLKYLTNWLQRYRRLPSAGGAGKKNGGAELLWLLINSCFCYRTLLSVGLRVSAALWSMPQHRYFVTS